MSTIARDITKGCGRALTIRIIAALIVIPLGCALILVPLYLVTTFDLSPWILAVSAGLFLVVLLGGGAAYMGIVLHQRKRIMDAAFTPLGLEGQVYMSFFRQYHGTVAGRQVDVWLYRGPILQLEISTSLQTRLGVTGPHGDTRFLAELAGRERLTLDDPASSGLTVFPHDEAWARTLLADMRAIDVLQRLTATEEQFTRQQVILRPGAFQLMLSGNKQMFGFQVTPEQVEQWLNDLLTLARIAENLHAPQVTDEISSTEEFSQKLRQHNPYLTVWIGLAMLVALLLCGGLITVLVLLLVGGL